MRNTYLRVGIIAVALAVVLGAVLFIHTPARAPGMPTENTVTADTQITTSSSTSSKPSSAEHSGDPVSSTLTTPVAVATSVATPTKPVSPADAAFIAIEGKTYTVDASADTTVLDAMQSLASKGSIAYTGRTYSSLGVFVESINGRAAANGYNWMLYVNGAQSQTGISSTPLHASDRIEWKYEK